MSTEVVPLNKRLEDEVSRRSKTVIYEGELLRHSAYTRVVHWVVAIFFVLSLLSGFAIFSPWLYSWLAPIFGSGARSRLLHPWFGLLFVIAFVFQMLNWLRPMSWRESDRRWVRRIKRYATNEERLEPEDVGMFNAGQKLWFWAIVVAAAIFLITGVIMWWPEVFGRVLMWISYFLHDVAALVMLGGFIIHIYEGTAQQPETFQSMIRGTVTKRWAWTHHPAWYREVTGRDPREDYERAARRQAERERIQALEGEQARRQPVPEPGPAEPPTL